MESVQLIHLNHFAVLGLGSLLGAYPIDDGLVVDADLSCNASKAASIQVHSHGATAQSGTKPSWLGIEDIETLAGLAVIALFACAGFARFDLTITAPASGADQSGSRGIFHN